MSGPAPVVSLAAINHRYDAVIAIAGIDLEIPAGTTTAFIGPDGAGKSTLLALIAGAKRIQTGMHVCWAAIWPTRGIGRLFSPGSPTCRRACAKTCTKPCRFSRT